MSGLPLKIIVRTMVLWILCLPVWATAKGELFQIELLCFENKDPARFDAEEWPAFVGKLETQELIKILSQAEMLAQDVLSVQKFQYGVPSVSDDKRLLVKEAKVIKYSKHHRLVHQTGWRQLLERGTRSKPVLVEGNVLPKVIDSNHEEPPVEFEAAVSVKQLRNVFHVNVDALFRSQMNDKKLGEFRITRNLRLKQKETYYIDHPVMGIILKISPVAAEEHLS